MIYIFQPIVAPIDPNTNFDVSNDPNVPLGSTPNALHKAPPSLGPIDTQRIAPPIAPRIPSSIGRPASFASLSF